MPSTGSIPQLPRQPVPELAAKKLARSSDANSSTHRRSTSKVRRTRPGDKRLGDCFCFPPRNWIHTCIQPIGRTYETEQNATCPCGTSSRAHILSCSRACRLGHRSRHAASASSGRSRGWPRRCCTRAWLRLGGWLLELGEWWLGLGTRTLGIAAARARSLGCAEG